MAIPWIYTRFLENNNSSENISYEVVEVFPHDPEAFTQGLVFHEGNLYEGTGLYGMSSLRRVDLETGSVLASYKLSNQVFGEGITVLGDRIYQLTWKAGICYIYNKTSLEVIDSFTYEGEGWGLTHNGENLIMSNGSNILTFFDPVNFSEVFTIKVTDEGVPVDMLNELEYVDGVIYANVWLTDNIVYLDTNTGNVLGWLDMSDLKQQLDYRNAIDVLNGIAYDGSYFYLTGKLWPNIFKVKFNR
ncbi:glutaminyl-peptide cyclotransferase [Candidatus Bathyarchaeota archaeon]|nr:glutaminyl-peptide cyclotransferase [Candidatus Bathyarchaeota archaeon]